MLHPKQKEVPLIIKEYLGRNKAFLVLTVLFTVLYSALFAGFAVVFEGFVDYCTAIKADDFSFREFALLSCGLLAYIACETMADFTRRKLRARIIVSVNHDVRMDYCKKLLDLEPMLFDKRNTGYYISRFVNDLPNIIGEYIIQWFNLVLYACKTVFCILAAFYINWMIAFAFLGLSAVIIIYTTSHEKRFKAIREEGSERNAEYVASLKSMLGGFDDIKMNRAESRFAGKYEANVNHINDTIRKWWNLEAQYSPACAFLTRLLTFFAIVISTLFYIRGLFSVGLLIAAIYLSSSIFSPISDFFEQMTYMKSYKNLAASVFNEVSHDEISYGEVSGQKEEPRTIISDFDSIVLENVSVQYGESTDYVLENINIEILPGKKYLITGKSGAGKSTLLKLLAGNLTHEGRIRFSSIDLQRIDKKSLRNIVSYVPQAPYIFDDSIYFNINLAGEHDEDEVNRVIEQVTLGDFVKSKGLCSPISEEVTEVSGGEKQRICLARALLKHPKLLLLDEVTASLDKKTAYEMEKLIVSLDMTILYVCHKVSEKLVESFDYLIEVKDKKIKICKAG